MKINCINWDCVEIFTIVVAVADDVDDDIISFLWSFSNQRQLVDLHHNLIDSKSP